MAFITAATQVQTRGFMRHCRQFHVIGKVQGVSFRASTCDQAQALDLKGHVRNLPDGGVEILAYGAPEAVQELAQWLKHGSVDARVDRIIAIDAPVPAALSDEFVILNCSA